MAEEQVEEIGIKTPFGELVSKGKKNSELIAALALAALIVIGYVLYDHKTDEKESKTALAVAIKEVAAAQREQTQIGREQTCLLALDKEQIKREFGNESSLCKRLSRER